MKACYAGCAPRRLLWTWATLTLSPIDVRTRSGAARRSECRVRPRHSHVVFIPADRVPWISCWSLSPTKSTTSGRTPNSAAARKHGRGGFALAMVAGDDDRGDAGLQPQEAERVALARLTIRDDPIRQGGLIQGVEHALDLGRQRYVTPQAVVASGDHTPCLDRQGDGVGAWREAGLAPALAT